MKCEVLHNQTIYDIAIQEHGSAEGVFQLLADNPGLMLSTELVSGQLLNINSTAVDQRIKDYYAINDLHPANFALQEELVLGTADDDKLSVGGFFIRVRKKST